MLRADMDREIDKIPGDSGWYHESGAEMFKKIAGELVTAGIDPAEALDLLERAYGAVASEFGA